MANEAVKARILVVDGGEDARDAQADLLASAGYGVVTAADGEQMLACLQAHPIDLVLLEVDLAGSDGFELCRYLCSDETLPPVVFVTARGDEVDRVVGLEMGADDYVVKPYFERELLARVKAVLRRAKRPPRSGRRGVFTFAGWRFCPVQMQLLDPDGNIVPLSSSETELLLAFVQYPQEPLSRDRLLDLTKGRESFPFDRSIDSHVSRLRRKLGDDAKQPEIIKTAWGTGYIFTYAVEAG
ncbi:response regulator [Microbulbifer salipaludis]|uniref:Response regulator n=1 Tax=Microbulbifer salipaludis TaxID=187980 RepID=A0ABS3E4L7_9GAMM|nr:response regulator [Microbulbifer salipaludis]MBN8430246.1 response regulator [Microbulbifer salipaludis]